jgi:hypothetical protein
MARSARAAFVAVGAQKRGGRGSPAAEREGDGQVVSVNEHRRDGGLGGGLEGKPGSLPPSCTTHARVAVPASTRLLQAWRRWLSPGLPLSISLVSRTGSALSARSVGSTREASRRHCRSTARSRSVRRSRARRRQSTTAFNRAAEALRTKQCAAGDGTRRCDRATAPQRVCPRARPESPPPSTRVD